MARVRRDPDGARSRATWLEDERRRLVTEWAPELAAALGRPAVEIAARGLGARDFGALGVRLRFADGSGAAFRHAFVVKSIEKEAVAVFTEHCGYFVVHWSTEIEIV